MHPSRERVGRAGLRVRTWLLVACLALAACTPKPPPLQALGNNDVVLAFGDSLTAGEGAGAGETYPEVLLDVLKNGSTKSDPIHPNAAGYSRMAQSIAALLREAGAI